MIFLLDQNDFSTTSGLPLPACFPTPTWARVLSLSLLSIWSEDADPLREALHISIFPALIVRGRRRRRRHKVSRVGQSMLLCECLPATVVALMGDVTLAEFCLQFSQIQPCLIVLRDGMKFQRQGPYIEGKWAFTADNPIITLGCVIVYVWIPVRT